MIVIQGKSGKSRVLEDIINNKLRNRNVIILDNVGVKTLKVPEGVKHYLVESYSTEQLLKDFWSGGDFNFSEYDWVVFEVNLDESKIDMNSIKELERRSRSNFIVTVQNDKEEIEVYFA